MKMMSQVNWSHSTIVPDEVKYWREWLGKCIAKVVHAGDAG
jgi:hypothetical protein